MDGHKYTALFEAPGGKPVLKVYRDTRGILTVGIGHTGPDVHEGDTWTEAHCWEVFYADYATAASAAPGVIGDACWSTLNEVRRAVIIDIVFNIGRHGLEKFHDTLAAIRSHQWQKAHDELLDSAYAGQVHGRATKNAQALLTGEWP